MAANIKAYTVDASVNVSYIGGRRVSISVDGQISNKFSLCVVYPRLH